MLLEIADPFSDVEVDRVRPAPRFLFDAARGRFLLRRIGVERRKAPRYYIAAEALARPLDADGLPAGEVFRGVVTDLSRLGLCLLHSRFVAADCLAVRIGLWSDSLTAVLQVSRVVHAGFHVEYAGPFIEPIEDADLMFGEH